MPEPERRPSSAPSDRPRRTLMDAVPKKREGQGKRLLLAALGAVVLIGGFLVYYRLRISDQSRHHEFEIVWPVASPRGEPIEIGHDLKAGDVFLTKYESHFLIVLSVENNINLKIGMNLDVALTLGHGVKVAPPDGPPGLVSTYRTAVNDARSTPPEWTAPVWLALNNSAVPCAFKLPRDASGAVTGKATGGPAAKEQRKVLDSVLCGLGEVTTNYLPPRPVRLGDVWDLDEGADLPGILTVVKYVARTDEYPGGYPEIRRIGKVAAEALETRDGEPCLRLRLVIYVTQEGDAVAPALPGRVSTAARIDGHVWISTTKGTLWEQDLVSEIMTSYLCARPTERHATAKLTAKTARGEHMLGE